MVRNCNNKGDKKKLKNFDRKLAKKPAANPPMYKDKKTRKFKKMENAKKEEDESETSTSEESGESENDDEEEGN
eukprot:2098751-Rhodomonas_salina.1